MTDKVNPRIQSFLAQGQSGLVRIPPEPKSRLNFDFSSILSSVGGMVGAAATSGISGAIEPRYLALINKQIEMQEQMQLVSLTSNVEKSRHESKMAAIRNVRTA
ncbi:MAG: hypothetical protein KDD70_03900 [Bdellovibrionales bacterium]|nr:hypothetical protein [Bdellovibrionales bacterium]